ncbi:MAG TPA: hypothetical protein VFP69_05515, partial [Streptomyces sp.]|nr:hypothetical protein [Streptomyces sp.]
WLWPYYDVFALFAEGDGLQRVHRPLYRDLPARHWLVLLGVAALAARWRRDHRDPLALFFALGVLVFTAGGLTGHYAWGRALPAALIPAQLAAALAAAGAPEPRPAEPAAPGAAPTRRRRGAVAGWAVLLAAALAVGAWTQAGALGYVLPRGALPGAVAAKYRQPWSGYHWITPWVRPGDVVMARTPVARQIPAYGASTVAPGYPDFFLPDERARQEAVRRFFAPGTAAWERRGIVRAYRVRWVVDRADALPASARSGLREVARGPGGQALYAVR